MRNCRWNRISIQTTQLTRKPQWPKMIQGLARPLSARQPIRLAEAVQRRQEEGRMAVVHVLSESGDALAHELGQPDSDFTRRGGCISKCASLALPAARTVALTSTIAWTFFMRASAHYTIQDKDA